MKVGSSIAVLVLTGLWPLEALAQHHGVSPEKGQAGALVKIVRESTERFRDVSVAEAEKYFLKFACVSGSHAGAMGLHFVNMDMVMDPEVDATRPEIVIYEPTPGGRLRLIGADYLVLKDAWDAKHPEGAPELMGQLFHLFESPNRFGLPGVLHVARLGVEGQPQRRVRQLAPQGVVRVI